MPATRSRVRGVAPSPPPRPAPETHVPKHPGPPADRWAFALPALALAAAVFAQVIGFDFVNWDDDVNVLENRGVLTGDWRAIWTETVIGNYNPLAISTFAVEHALVGLAPALYHATNLGLHLACVALVFALGRRTGLGPAAAGLLAGLFAVHPMRVESVAWVTERKDVLFGALYLAALVRYEGRRRRGARGSWFWGVAALFALSLLAKIQAVSLPLAMLCLDYLRQPGLQGGPTWAGAWRREVVAKAPYFAMSLAVGLAGVYFLGESGSLTEATDYTAFDRLAVGAYAFATYLGKAVWPAVMSPLYPYPASLPWEAYASLPAVAALAAAAAWAARRGYVAAVFALAFFAVNVVFMLQVVGAGQGFLADRFTYIGYAGLFWGLAYGAQVLARNRALRRPLALGLAAYVLALAATAHRQAGIWRDGEALWAHVAELYPRSATALGNRAQWIQRRGRVDEALALYGEAIAAEPGRGTYHNSRGKLHFDAGRVPRALDDYDAGIAVEPDLAELHVNRGAALASLGDYPAAEEALARGLALEPGDFNGLLNRSLLRYTTGRVEEALADYDELLRQRPERHDLWQERGSIRASRGHTAGGIADLREALRRAPDEATRRRYATILGDLEAGAR